MVHRRRPDLFFIGLYETDGAAYPLFGRQADLIAHYLAARRAGDSVDAFDRQRATAYPDLRGGRHYADSRRHTYYVKMDSYERLLDSASRLLVH